MAILKISMQNFVTCDITISQNGHQVEGAVPPVDTRGLGRLLDLSVESLSEVRVHHFKTF